MLARPCWGRALSLLAALSCLTAPYVWAQGELAGARAAYNEGRYDDAISGFTRLVRRQPASAEAARGLVRALGEVGRYRDAEHTARRFVERNSRSPELWTLLGEVLLRQGRRDEAERAFANAVRGGASDSLAARLNLAILRYERGDVAEAMREFDAFIDVYNQTPRLNSDELTAVATAVRYLGVNDPQLYRDALRAYDEAVSAAPHDFEPQLLIGELFLEKYSGTEALETFDSILAKNPNHPRALLGLARTRRFAGSPEALQLARRSIEINPNLVPARVFLATLYIELEDYGKAAREVGRALEVDSTTLQALSVLAAIRFLQGDQGGFDEARRRAFSLNPRFAGFYNTLAEVSARNRLYHLAVRFAQQAVELDPKSWRGYGLLGINQLRVGSMEAGRENLEVAFEGDPYDVWTKNTLDLLDTLAHYSETATARFRFVIDGKESRLLSLYAGELAEEAYDRLAARYGYRPATPIRVEVYPSHADFSVRTVGLVGVGALGVSFGPVLAMDSPSARELGSFNWGSTLWHEIAHTFHLGVTDHKVPRWFSEGLAVLEERRARPGWGGDVSPGFLMAFREGRLLPVGELNNGFMRPQYPEQVAFSYYQASLVCELIERDHGPQALSRMLQGYRDGRSTSAVFRSVLHTDLEAFNEVFERYLRDRFGRALAALGSVELLGAHGKRSRDEVAERVRRDPDDFAAQLAMGQMLTAEGRLDEAVPHLERAKSLFPEYAGPGNPYWHLALIHKRQGAARKAVEELLALTAINGGNYQAFLELAGLQESLQDSKGAAEALDRALYVYPMDIAVHRRLAELSAELGDWGRAIRERRAAVALDPVDRAKALYQLARAYFSAGDRESARRTVVQALEIAPNYAAAQDLLLEIHDARKDR
ncbi:MAG: tetratricopeptide repeat protein [Gemmatimonadales bacterium]|nr:tetratricopeptide repeat protein [Gemmatimonadales bacterium]NIN11842.1 tetratricopeptide repeat protein [Gemmatimonadales bacterium]NIN50392.1 tetratricopeptide repeat protein [Gemmatimonadales bacterium]NIP07856.1 tetratricopeptide repeat protein [Gemmatimonadales bacterium]NIR02061.1 tetratricopeptide repeat protein [Gemmatimonadales bacterium]